MFKNVAKLTYGNHYFIIDKFSGFDKVEFSINKTDFLSEKKITYYMNIYFSGQVLKLEKATEIKVFENTKRWFKTKYTPEYSFIYNTFKNGLYHTFTTSGYKSGESNDIIPDIVRWFAENTNTKNTLEELKEDIKFCLEFIDKYYLKKSEKI